MRAISVKLPDPIYRKLTELAKASGKTKSEIVRDGIEALADHPMGSFLLDPVHHLIGVFPGGPPDLATNPKHLEGLGLDNAQLRALRAAGKK